MFIFNVAYGRTGASVVKNGLPRDKESCYIDYASLNHGVGCGNSKITIATQFAYASFFCVVKFCLCYQVIDIRMVYGYLSSMVTQAGQPSGWLVSIVASISTPVCVATHILPLDIFYRGVGLASIQSQIGV